MLLQLSCLVVGSVFLSAPSTGLCCICRSELPCWLWTSLFSQYCWAGPSSLQTLLLWRTLWTLQTVSSAPWLMASNTWPTQLAQFIASVSSPCFWLTPVFVLCVSESSALGRVLLTSENLWLPAWPSLSPLSDSVVRLQAKQQFTENVFMPLISWFTCWKFIMANMTKCFSLRHTHFIVYMSASVHISLSRMSYVHCS